MYTLIYTEKVWDRISFNFSIGTISLKLSNFFPRINEYNTGIYKWKRELKFVAFSMLS